MACKSKSKEHRTMSVVCNNEDYIPTMLTIDETALRCNLSAYTIRRWVKSGELKSVKVGRKYLINWDNVIEFLRQGNEREVQVYG